MTMVGANIQETEAANPQHQNNGQRVTVAQQQQQQISQPKEQQSQDRVQGNVKDDRAKFVESIKVAEPMSDAEFWRSAKEAKETGKKITDPAWIAKYQQMRQKAARDKHQNNMNRQAPIQERE